MMEESKTVLFLIFNQPSKGSTNMQKILLDERQVSDAIRLKVATLRKRRWLGLAPRFLKVGSKVFYDQNDVQDYLNTCVRQSTSDTGDRQ